MDQYTQTYNQETFHGGDLSWAKKNFGGDGPSWIDLSTGINPHPYPIPELPSDIWARLPDPALDAELLRTAGKYYGLPGSINMTACPGTQSVLQRLPHLRKQTEVAILSPTYAEHAKCWRAAGHDVIHIESLQEIPSSTQIVVVVSPNNPTGDIADFDILNEVQQRLTLKGGLLVVDEAFMDINPTKSYIPHIPQKGVVILKSFGKFFGLAGLRLGFALGDPDIMAGLKAEFGPWAVSGPAAFIGETALSDTVWITQMRMKLAEETRKLSALLERVNLQIIGKTDLFTLVKTHGATELFQHLCDNRILTRPFQDNPSYLRFGMPGSENQWSRLDQALNTFTDRSAGIE